MKPLSIEEIKQLKEDDWVWIVSLLDWDNYYKHGQYVQVDCDEDGEDGLCFIADCKCWEYVEYGKTWLAYKNKEQADCKGELVELPNEKWCITIGSKDTNENDNYMIEHLQPYAEYYKGKWHIGYKNIEWRTIIETFDTYKQAEQKLKELRDKV